MKYSFSFYLSLQLVLFASIRCMQPPLKQPDEKDHIPGFEHVNVSPLDDGTVTPLHRAAEGGRLDEVRRLLETGAQSDARTSRGETPLHYAARGGHVEIARLIIERLRTGRQDATMNQLHASNIDPMEEPGPLHVATLHDHKGLVEYFVNGGVHIDGRTSQAHLPLHYAAFGGTPANIEMAERFIRAGIDIYATELHANTPLHIAAFYNREPFVRFLLVHHAPAYLRNLDGQTPLDIAALRGHHDIVRLLLPRAQSINLRTIYLVALRQDEENYRAILTMLLTRSVESTDVHIHVSTVRSLPDRPAEVTITLEMNQAQPIIIEITPAMLESPHACLQTLAAHMTQFTQHTQAVFNAVRPLFNVLMFFMLNTMQTRAKR